MFGSSRLDSVEVDFPAWQCQACGVVEWASARRMPLTPRQHSTMAQGQCPSPSPVLADPTQRYGETCRPLWLPTGAGGTLERHAAFAWPEGFEERLLDWLTRP